ncbi:hypothetical protein [Catellatospora chokoriensis]|uniref:site-specific DNA-methyltransferase (cytosine-N(4)-specific) n=1 Tax=Catellatospora chokoriensis TaxID=310353 RepID=A0A8J3NT95_9ACTN|nr:hypothetical protein [Catellatospora chokoriensis]GIF90020.1 hypothetical protein Cch02nite_34640 [Catellatospora chokoriensis]
MAQASKHLGAQQATLFPDPVTHTASRRLSPKRPRVETAGLADVFPYYAGFSFEWAVSRLQTQVQTPADVVLDPWNGSGTTTLAARSLDLPAVGIDLNPIANVVAGLRLQVTPAATPLSPPGARRAKKVSTDPLSSWLSSRAVNRLRDWTEAADQADPATSALARVALFRIVRRITKSFEGTNPTWVRRVSADQSQLDYLPRDLDELLVEDQRFILDRLAEAPTGQNLVALLTASSSALPLRDSSIDVILTSPPYLTRIDYAVAYARELAILGVDIASDRTLRSSLMGTTLIRAASGHAASRYGPLATQLVSDVASHKSKASSGYYLKQVRQYLDDLYVSFEEISRVAKPGARMTMVVQDSYYKDIPINLAGICMEAGHRLGWHCSEPEQLEVSRTLTTLNKAARAYPKEKVVESVLTMRKLGS